MTEVYVALVGIVALMVVWDAVRRWLRAVVERDRMRLEAGKRAELAAIDEHMAQIDAELAAVRAEQESIGRALTLGPRRR